MRCYVQRHGNEGDGFQYFRPLSRRVNGWLCPGEEDLDIEFRRAGRGGAGSSTELEWNQNRAGGRWYRGGTGPSKGPL